MWLRKIVQCVGRKYSKSQAFGHQVQNGIEAVHFHLNARLAIQTGQFGLDEDAKRVRAAGNNEGQRSQCRQG